MMNRLVCVVLGLLIFNPSATADDKRAAEDLLRNKIDFAIEVLQRKESELQARNKKILEIVSPIFDFPLMAKLALGREYWPSLSEEKKKKYLTLFTERLKAAYLDKLTLYTDERVVYKMPVQDGRKIRIPTELISKGDTVSMLYKMYKSRKGWKIYDIEIQGVSIISSYRSQFKEILSKGTIDDLLLKLETNET
ncbi:MAG: ABC transporter substrate-binding protein [Desulfobacterales bacterium]|nr:MAG: ABC transporter substrate-binding protein [Desulfobacterales bacterium]